MDEDTSLLLAEIEGLASSATPTAAPVTPQTQPLSLADKILGYSRSYLAGPTFNLADEAEANIVTGLRSLFGNLPASQYEQAKAQELESIRAQQNKFREQYPISSIGTEVVSGMVLNPLDKLKKVLSGGSALAKVVSTPVRIAATNPISQAGLAGFGAGEGGLTERLKSAGTSAAIGAAGSAVATSAGKVMEKAGREADRLKLSAYGIKGADLNKAFKKMSKEDFSDPYQDISILDVVKKAEAEDLIRPDGELLQNVSGIVSKQNDLFGTLKPVLDEVDQVLPPMKNVNFSNTQNFINKLTGSAREKAEAAAQREIKAITSQLGNGTLDDLQRLKVGLNYKFDENPYTDDVIKAVRSDLRQEIEDRVAFAADNGLIDASKRNVVGKLNKEYGEYDELYDIFKKKASSMYGGDIVEDAFGAMRTSGGAGTLINASAATGNPLLAMTGAALTAGRTSEAKAALGDILETYKIPLQIAGEVLPEAGRARNIAQVQTSLKDRPESEQTNRPDPMSLLAEIEALAGGAKQPTQLQVSASGRTSPLETIKSEVKKVSKKAEENKTILLQELANAGITDQAEANQFLAQMEHESAGFKKLREIGSGERYEGRKDLGNTQKGDGARFKGRGFIQLTGRANYEKFGKMLGLDLVKNPELAERPDIAAKIAVAYWQDRVRPKVSDFNDVKKVTKLINGGYNGLADREKRFSRYSKESGDLLALLTTLANQNKG